MWTDSATVSKCQLFTSTRVKYIKSPRRELIPLTLEKILTSHPHVLVVATFLTFLAYSASISGNNARLRWIFILYYFVINISGQIYLTSSSSYQNHFCAHSIYFSRNICTIEIQRCLCQHTQYQGPVELTAPSKSG
jgi:hypothetical protein